MLTLNVIYTRGTITRLSFLVWSLLEHSEYCFRLVANGCTFAEMAALQRLAARSPRLSFVALPAKGIMPHGQALNYLQAGTRDERFGFIDSDIFTVDPLPTRQMLTDAKACMCSPSTLFRSSEDSMPANLGAAPCTYLAVYDNAALTKVIRSAGIGFDKYHWPEIAPEHQQHLIRLGVGRTAFDTAQLVTLLLLEPGETPHSLRTSQLIHIGGFSRSTTRREHFGPLGALRRVRHRVNGERVKELAARIYSSLLGLEPGARTTAVWVRRATKDVRKRVVTGYVADLIDALLAGAPPPWRPGTGDAYVDGKLEEATRVITALFEKYGADHLAVEHRPPQPWTSRHAL